MCLIYIFPPKQLYEEVQDPIRIAISMANPDTFQVCAYRSSSLGYSGTDLGEALPCDGQ